MANLNTMKLDAGKAPIARGFSRYFPRAISAVALVSLFGFEKYKAWGGWKQVDDAFNRYDDALGRHDKDMARGETHCPESKQLHLAHRAWNALATLELYLIEEEAKRGEASIEQERKDQSWADAANQDWRAEQFERLKQAVLPVPVEAPKQCKVCGSAGMELYCANDECPHGIHKCDNCTTWADCKRIGQCFRE